MSANMKIKKKGKKEAKNINDAVFKDAVDDFDKFEDFFTTNLKNIIIGSIVAVVVLIVGYLIFIEVQESKKEAAIALNEAKSIEELNSAIKKYPNSAADKTAQLNLATIYFKDGKFEEALKVYQSIARTASPGDIKSRANLNIAYTLESLNKAPEAAEKFATIGVNNSFPEYIRNEANYSAARIFIACKKNARAKDALKLIKSNNPGDFWASQALRLKQRLNADDPIPKAEKPKTSDIPSIKDVKETTKKTIVPKDK